tara:strand:- start:1290 stop:1586 length:297 start_codon:yes stop_codon:yes gene_type:complete
VFLGFRSGLKDIEKSQTKPTAAMLFSLFEQSEPTKKPLLIEKKYSTERKQDRSVFEAAHELMQRIYTDFEFNTKVTNVATPIHEVIKEKKEFVKILHK